MTSSRSKRMSTSRSTSMPLLVQTMATRKASRVAAKSGVKTRVSTGAMFSMTLCLASTSHADTMTAAMAPHGSSHELMNSSASRPMASKVPIVKRTSTPPPSPMRTK